MKYKHKIIAEALKRARAMERDRYSPKKLRKGGTEKLLMVMNKRERASISLKRKED
jgi:hypothetical protein